MIFELHLRNKVTKVPIQDLGLNFDHISEENAIEEMMQPRGF